VAYPFDGGAEMEVAGSTLRESIHGVFGSLRDATQCIWDYGINLIPAGNWIMFNIGRERYCGFPLFPF